MPSSRNDDMFLLPGEDSEFGDRRRRHGNRRRRHGSQSASAGDRRKRGKRRQTKKQRAASLRNLRKAHAKNRRRRGNYGNAAITRVTRAPETRSADFGDRRRRRHGSKADRRRHRGRHHTGLYGLFTGNYGDARRGGRRLKRPYLKSKVRRGRAISGKHRIGKVAPRSSKHQFRWVTRGGGVYAGTIKTGGRRRKKK